MVAACSKPPTATGVCKQLETAGVAAGCHTAQAGGLGGAASEYVEFELPSVPGHGGAVYRFQTDADYTTTTDGFQRAAALAGPHRYGNAKARTFVQMNSGASSEVGAKVKAVVDSL